MKNIYIVACLALFFATSTTAFAESSSACGEISRNLRLGMTGSDVKILQQVLNKSVGTLIASSGAGSRGQETTYFGAKTMAAVIKFQNLYAKEVLTPVGLTHGSGFVGQYSRAMLLQLCKTTAVISTIPPSTHLFSTTTGLPLVSPAFPATLATATLGLTTASSSILETTVSAVMTGGFHSNTPVIMFPSMYTGPRGSTVKISTIGLATSGNIVHFDNYLIKQTTLESSGQLIFVIPMDAPMGYHDLWISSTKGETNKTFFIVTDPTVAPPIVTSFTPKEGFLGKTVTVSGSGFLPEGNTVRISYGIISNIPSVDGKTLKFSVSPPIPFVQPGEDRPEIDVNIGYWFSIMNKNGLSGSSVFNLKI